MFRIFISSVKSPQHGSHSKINEKIWIDVSFPPKIWIDVSLILGQVLKCLVHFYIPSIIILISKGLIRLNGTVQSEPLVMPEQVQCWP